MTESETKMDSPEPQANETTIIANHVPDSTEVLHNAQLSLVILGLWLSLFLCSLETTIVSTSLIHIASDLNDLSNSGWIVVAYLLTFNAFILIWSKLSDTFGTKWLLLSANTVFCIFSIACAVSKTMVQLIIFRAFQGIGGSGMYSLTFVILAQVVPMDKLGICTGILSSVFALASLLGPILGGVISDKSTWRWIFWLNVPGIAFAFAILAKFMNSGKSSQQVRRSMKAMDIVGAFLSLAWAILLIFALQEGGKAYEWDSGVIIGTLVSGIAVLIVFALWEWWTYRYTNTDSLFPVGLLKRSVVVLLFLNLLLLGFTFYVPVIQIPQRFQYVNGQTATRAGILLLPLTLVSPTTALVAGSLVGRHRLWAPALTILGGCLNLVGITLMSTLPVDNAVPGAQFGYQVIIGMSLGLMTPTLLYILKVEVPEKEMAGAMGVGNMGRTLGGCIGLAICGSLLQSELNKELPKFLTPQQIQAITASSGSAAQVLTPEQLIRVGRVYGDGFDLEFKGLIAFAGLSVITAVLLWFSHTRSLKNRIQGEDRERGEAFREMAEA
ncbi:putative MFS multidrug transporter [Annulohypoxylon truncatum]|uniref:putative MFS multidrug transporter n=1 Tax=Annulohypoxylon truncatum TaxID=327061 RepID=UPI0020084D63|nr:putative MFS multidrug transporter [Annulohypoxylon truncatum]KAI1204357.1 putative MFS multidrug transporter [Annulohypoxylon truncatum]